ncbi:hypothetical protein M2132_001004 [Dysgonomonas sp. PH5-45]|uniref:DUF6371 domain-containing protein n=1 Tax=unclassified Dysgonomonas TaxID=2630389 RepID=UPI0024762A00|nr:MULTISPECIES: DUF6371 domain-containing protein [unclassified Dysgonomonas]MDH6354675.1 hypothetical protein [Dysgonomonas sp. PH5-45]MDH6387572.1 hypothetical protein [Dysgonomonas sp. PH5-37]
MNYRFHLEKYKTPSSRHTCPACGQKRIFVRYVDSKESIKFPNYVGRCNREQKCGYHYTPKQYFIDNPTEKEEQQTFPIFQKHDRETVEPDYLDQALLNKSLKHYDTNNLFLFFQSKFGYSVSELLFKKYQVGTANHWNGSTVFWQIDQQDRIRTGKIMLYDPQTGKRVKKPHSHITWVHSLLKQENYQLKQCFFGEHLLRENKTSPIAIVESEKTAMVASIYIPQYIWIATGGKNGCLNQDNMLVLKNRKVVLFPDLGAKDYWDIKREQMSDLGIEVIVSDYLERYASKEQIKEGYDIADFLIKSSPQKNICQQMIEKNPMLNLLIETFELKVI